MEIQLYAIITFECCREAEKTEKEHMEGRRLETRTGMNSSSFSFFVNTEIELSGSKENFLWTG